jgi:tellurite resistance protein
MERRMSHEFLDDRRRAMEEAFFAKQDAELIRRMQKGAAPDTQKESLSAASGITDPALLEKLVGLGLDSNTLAALSLVPLVAVAWADGSIEEKERAALLSAAADSGLDRSGTAYQLLTGWLATRPSPQLVETWADYIKATSAGLGEDARRALKLSLLGRARRVAEAAGGFLGLASKVSPAEEAVLTRLEQAFAH